MKILYITSTRMPTDKAHGYQIMKMCESFGEEHELLLLAPIRKKDESAAVVDDIYAYYAVARRFKIEKLGSLDPAFLRWVSPKLRFLVHASTFALAVVGWLFKHGREFDVVYSRDPITLHLFTKLNRFFRLRAVFESHEYPETGSRRRAKLAKRLCGLVVVTRSLKEQYVRAGVDETRVIVASDAVDLSHFDRPVSKSEARRQLGISVDVSVASFVGSFHTMGMEKGIPEIIESAKYLFEEFPNLSFYFVGGPLDRAEKYRDTIDRENLPKERFVFLEKQAINDVPLWMKASDILLMPHPKNTFYSFYASPLKMFEYMASHRPIVASRLPAIEEILVHGSNALLGEPGNPRSIGENIAALLKDPGACQRLADHAFEDVKQFTWTRRAKRIADFISSTPKAI